MIHAENLTKLFDDFLAVDRVNLRVEKGEVLALLGPNGAGKTTTVRMFSSVLRPTRGRASIAGFDVVEHPEQVRASVGVLTENHGLYNRMPADEYLDFFGQVYALDAPTRRDRIGNLLDLFGLTKDQKRKVGEYSKGMRQKLALARAMLHAPPVLLLDEPTSAMDPESARLVRDSIKNLRSEERTVIICTHNLAEAEELADRIAIIRSGRIIANGTSKSLKQEFLGPAEYEVRFSDPLNGAVDALPDGIELRSTGESWLRYWSNEGEAANPAVLRYLLDKNLPVVNLQEVPRSLEQVYLQIMFDLNVKEAENA